jgi:pectinesterase
MKHLLATAALLLPAALTQAATITVASDGSGNFKTVQQAIASVPENSTDKIDIHVKPGTYTGSFVIPKNKPNITLHGDDAASTILTWDRNVRDPIPEGNDKFNPGLQVQADNFTAYNLTIQNTSGDHGQALALRVDGDRDIFLNCTITGWQDTLMVNNGRDYFANCFISGRVDFIYGSATAWFQDCEIHSRNGGHVTAASTPQDHAFGFVFANCKLTGDSIPYDPATTNPSTTMKPKVTPIADLGRPWRPYASVTYLNCEMGDHIKPEGWNNWGKTTNEKTARYSEYKSTGPGSFIEKRYPWTHRLTDDDADKITVETVLAGDDHWDPVSIAKALNLPPTTQK